MFAAMPKSKFFAMMSALILTFSTQSFAQFLVRGDADYLQTETANVQYIFSQENAQNLPELEHYMSYFMQRYTESFAWTLDEHLRLVVASRQNQIANGFATPSPLLQTVHFPSGTELLDQFAEDSFLMALASHETAHLYQLSAKSRLSSMAKGIVGNVPFVITPVVPIFIFPNAFLPRFALEGNAVMNESAIGRGGRLWSGEVRASVIADIRAKQVSPKELLNARLEFPLDDAYRQGGYFSAFLAEKFGINRANQFFKTHAERDIWPFNMNKSFRQHFGVSYSRLIHDYLQWMEPLTKSYVPAAGSVLAKSFTRPLLNHSGSEIFFVGNPDGRQANRLFQISKTDGSIKSTPRDLPDGKAFLLDDGFYSVTSSQVNPTEILYGLYTDGLKPKKETLGFLYQDMRGGHTVKVDQAHSYARNRLLKDDQPLDDTASSAILNEQGQAYYFKQVGDERVLYRDRQPLFKFRGYYGIPTEVSGDEVRFIASTKAGASLFRWSKGQIERLFPFDNIVDAREIGSNKYIAAVVTSEGYEIQTLEAKPANEVPAYYDWKYVDKVALPKVPEAPAAAQNNLAQATTYSPLTELHYSQANIVWSGAGGQISALFTDPLQWNILSFGYAWNNDPDHAGGFTYVHNRHRLGWLLSAQYSDDTVKKDTGDNSHYSGQAILAADYHLLKWRRWSSTLDIGPRWSIGSDESRSNEQNYGAFADWNLVYHRQDYGLAYGPYRLFMLDYSHRTDWSTETGRKTDSVNGGNIQLSGDIYRQTYLSARGSWAKSERDSIKVKYLKAAEPLNFSVPLSLGDGQAREVREWEVELLQAIDWSYYFPRFPVSLRRFAPFVSLRDVYTRESTKNDLPGWRQQVQYGSEFELLILNNFGARVRSAFDTIKVGARPEYGWHLEMSLKKNF